MHPIVRLSIPAAFVAAIAALTIAVTDASSASPASQSDSVAVANVVKDFHNALSNGDSAKALGLLSNDAVILESGWVEPRAEYRSHHLAEDIKFAKAVGSQRGPLQVKVQGTSAWTVGTSASKGKFEGKAIDSIGAESMVLTKESSGWRIRSIHWSSHRRPGST
jgi:ketosteroid isomerase-like protein